MLITYFYRYFTYKNTRITAYATNIANSPVRTTTTESAFANSGVNCRIIYIPIIPDTARATNPCTPT